jgi:hypothetical protein
MTKCCLAICAIALGFIGSVVPAGAAAIALTDRSDCNCYTEMGSNLCFCYASGTVTTDNANDVINKVDNYVETVFAGRQTSGFSHSPGTTTWGYAFCDDFQQREVGGGPYETRDTAFKQGQIPPLATGTKNWSP